MNNAACHIVRLNVSEIGILKNDNACTINRLCKEILDMAANHLHLSPSKHGRRTSHVVVPATGRRYLGDSYYRC